MTLGDMAHEHTSLQVQGESCSTLKSTNTDFHIIIKIDFFVLKRSKCKRLIISKINFSFFLQHCTSNSAHKHVLGQTIILEIKKNCVILQCIKLIHQEKSFPRQKLCIYKIYQTFECINKVKIIFHSAKHQRERRIKKDKKTNHNLSSKSLYSLGLGAPKT